MRLRLSNLLAINQLVIGGVVVKPPVFRETPAGIPLLQCILEHSSMQTEAGLTRKNRLRIRVFMLGNEAKQLEGQLKAGSKVKVSGFLDEQRFSASDPRIVIHANTIEPL